MWNPEYCGPGPSANLRLVIQPDPVGVDDRRLNKEYVAIVNDGVERVDLSGWVIRDGSLDWLRLPAGTGVDPAAVLTIRSGSGRNTASTVYWSRRSPVWANFTTAAGTRTRFGFIGDGAYLIDPVGNVRASKVYPAWAPARIRPGTVWSSPKSTTTLPATSAANRTASTSVSRTAAPRPCPSSATRSEQAVSGTSSGSTTRWPLARI